MDNQVDDNPRRWERSCLEEVKARFHRLQSEIAAWGLTILAIELEGAPPTTTLRVTARRAGRDEVEAYAFELWEGGFESSDGGRAVPSAVATIVTENVIAGA